MIFDSFRARVGIVLLRGSDILLIRNAKQNPPTFHLPGDVVKLGETLEESCKRSVKEQTGLDIDIKKMLYVRDDAKSDKHRLDIIFLGKLSEQQNLIEGNSGFKLDWININLLSSMNLFPQFLREYIVEAHREKFSKEAKYVGNLE